MEAVILAIVMKGLEHVCISTAKDMCNMFCNVNVSDEYASSTKRTAKQLKSER